MSGAVMPTNPHRIEVEISGHPYGLRGEITFTGVCDAPEGAPCRMWCDDPNCLEEAREGHAEHLLRDQGECGAVGSLNADPGFIPELYNGPPAPLRSGSINLVQDCDGVSWSYADESLPSVVFASAVFPSTGQPGATNGTVSDWWDTLADYRPGLNEYLEGLGI